MEVQTKDYKGDCRRNGGKLKLTTSDWIKILVLVAGIISSAGYLKWQVQALAKDAEAQIVKDEKQDKEIVENKENNIKVQKDVSHIKEKLDDFVTEQTIVNKLIQKMAGKMGVE